MKIKNIFGEDNKTNFSFSSCIIKYWNKLKDEDEEENNENNISFKYQNFWINGLKIIIFELIAIFFILRIFTLLNYFSFNLNGKKDINQYFNNFTLNFNFTRDNEDKSWNNFISNEYRCLSLDIYDLLDENYSFNITCKEGKQFYYISKFGVSPFNEENENIAECFSSSFKNLIKVDTECDLTNYLDEQLRDYKYKEANIEININQMNLTNTILNKCNNKNQRKKFFLSYSCYIPNVSYYTNEFKRRKIITYYLILGTLILMPTYLDFITFRRIFFEQLNNNENKNIKNLTLMIDSINIERNNVVPFLNRVLLCIKNILNQDGKSENNQYYEYIREINYSFLNGEEKKLYEQFNNLLQKKYYLESIIKNGKGNETLPRNIIFKIFSTIFCFNCCCRKTYKIEYLSNEKELKEIFKKIEQEQNSENIKKIYITFSSYKYKKIFKNKKIEIDHQFYILKKADLFPNDINWENLNINKGKKYILRFISYFLLAIFIFSFFLIILFISRVQNTFERKYNLSTDCTNIINANITGEIYNEFIDKNITEKEKIYTYCYCQSDSNGNKIFYDNLEFDPCQDYNKQNYKRKLFVHILSAIISIVNLGLGIIVDKIISIQKFESKSNQNNLKITISILILLFTNNISVILINARFTSNKIITFFIFGKYEDITPEWIKSIPNTVAYSLIYSMIIFFVKSVFKIISQKCIKLNFLWENPINHYYNFIKIYAPEIDYSEYSVYIIFFFLTISIFPMDIAICLAAFIFILYYSFVYFNTCLIKSYSFFINKQYFKIFFIFIISVFIIFIFGDFWWYSSEYYFIDIDEDVYNDFFGSNKELIDKFLKGNANILEKITAKLLLKRNISFYVQIALILLLEFLFLFCKPDKNDESLNESSLVMNDYISIKYYEIYRLLFNKICILNNSNYRNNEYYNFIEFKYNDIISW